MLLGSAAGLTATGAQYLIGEVFDPAEPAAREGFGGVLALADFNGDGRADLAAGRPGAPLGVTAKSRGRVSVVYTGPGGVLRPETAQDWNLEANFPNTDQALAWFGEALGSGDFTGDGIADLAVGASASGVAGFEQDGAVYLLHGSPRARRDPAGPDPGHPRGSWSPGESGRVRHGATGRGPAVRRVD